MEIPAAVFAFLLVAFWFLLICGAQISCHYFSRLLWEFQNKMGVAAAEIYIEPWRSKLDLFVSAMCVFNVIFAEFVFSWIIAFGCCVLFLIFLGACTLWYSCTKGKYKVVRAEDCTEPWRSNLNFFVPWMEVLDLVFTAFLVSVCFCAICAALVYLYLGICLCWRSCDEDEYNPVAAENNVEP